MNYVLEKIREKAASGLCEECGYLFKIFDLIAKFVMIGTKKFRYYHCKDCDRKLKERGL